MQHSILNHLYSNRLRKNFTFEHLSNFEDLSTMPVVQQQA